MKFRKKLKQSVFPFVPVKNFSKSPAAQMPTQWSLVSKLIKALKSQDDADSPEPYSEGLTSISDAKQSPQKLAGLPKGL